MILFLYMESKQLRTLLELKKPCNVEILKNEKKIQLVKGTYGHTDHDSRFEHDVINGISDPGWQE